MDLDRFARHLHDRPRLVLEPGDRRRAAVLVAVAGPGPERWSTLLVVRSAGLTLHAGQIGFPGGMMEPADRDAPGAALREAREEVGLSADRARVLGPLDEVVTLSSNVHITPVVAAVEDLLDLRADGKEVERLLEVPLATLRDPGRRTWETYTVPQGSIRVPVYRVPERVWGATARILHTLVLALEEIGA